MSINFLKTLNREFDATVLLSSVLTQGNEYMYHNQQRKHGGLAIMWRKNIGYAIKLLKLPLQSDRIMVISVNMPDRLPLFIINVYCPTTNASITDYNDVIDDLQVLYDTYKDQGIVILCGDFNAQLGVEAGPRGNSPQSIRGKCLVRFLDHNNVYSSVTEGTCTGPLCTYWPDDDHKSPTQIDHFILNREYKHIVVNCSVSDDDSANTSDHCPIHITIGTLLRRYYPAHRTMYNWSLCNVELYGQVLRSVLHDKMCELTISGKDGIDTYLARVQECITIAMTQCVPLMQRSHYKRPYWDNELKMAHNIQKEKRMVWVQEGRPRGMQHASYQSYKSSKKVFAKMLRAKLIEFDQRKFEQAEKAYDLDSQSLWKFIKSHKNSGNNMHTIKCDGRLYSSPSELREVWSRHYNTLLNEQPSEAQEYDNTFSTHITDEINQIKETMSSSHDHTGVVQSAFSVSEVANVCKSLPNRKAAGIDNIAYEGLKYGGFALYEKLSYLFNAIIKHVHVPKSLKHNIIIPVHKGKRKPRDELGSYRGISLSPTISKLLEKVIMDRLNPWLELHSFPPDLQHAGRKGTSCVSISYMVQEVINYYTNMGSKVYTCLLDIKQAFDSIWWNGLLHKLYSTGIRGKLWWLFNEWLSGSSCSVLINGDLSERFSISRSIKQGGLLSMFFFTVAYHDIHSHAILPPAKGLMYDNLDVTTPTFADDTIIMSLSVNNLQLILNNVCQYGRQWRIKFSPTKSMCITFGETKQNNNRNRSTRQWHLGDCALQEVDHAVYLGTKLCAFKCNKQLIQDRCKKGFSYLGSLTAIGFNHQGMNPVTSATLWHRLCIPSMLFACEVWGAMSSKEYETLERVQRKVAKHLQGLHKRTHNEVSIGLLGWCTIESNINRLKLLFLRHLITLDNKTNVKRVFLHEMYRNLTNSEFCTNTITYDLINIVSKYGLNQYVCTYLSGGVFPGKKEWSNIVKEKINFLQSQSWRHGLAIKGVSRYCAVQPMLKPNILYEVIRQNKINKTNIMSLIQMLSVPDKCYDVTCNLCGKVICDYVDHVFTRCEMLIDVRSELWDNILDILGVQAEVELFKKEDEESTRIMLGMNWDFLDSFQFNQFVCTVARSVCEIVDKTKVSYYKSFMSS
jgi:hypothetical protein